HDHWETILLEAGYLFAFFDGLNRYYVRQEEPELLKRFEVPVNVLDGYELAETHAYRTQALQLQSDLEQTQKQLQLHEADRLHLLSEAERLHRDIKYIDSVAQQREAERGRLEAEVAAWRTEAERLRVEMEQARARVQRCEADRLHLLSEAERLHRDIKNIDGVARLRGGEVERLQEELHRVETLAQEREAER